MKPDAVDDRAPVVGPRARCARCGRVDLERGSRGGALAFAVEPLDAGADQGLVEGGRRAHAPGGSALEALIASAPASLQTPASVFSVDR
jgi:hypothetical protein